MSTKKVYEQLAYDEQTKRSEIKISWTRTAESAAKHDRGKEELQVSVLRDWRKRLNESLTYNNVRQSLADWDNSPFFMFEQETQEIVRRAFEQFIEDVDKVYDDKEERIAANKQKRLDRKEEDKKRTKERKKTSSK